MNRGRNVCAGLAAAGVVASVAGLPAPALAAAAPAASVVRYRYVQIRALGTNEFGTYNNAAAINAAGEVVGSSSVPDSDHAFSWQNGHLTDLSNGRGSLESEGLGIDDSGDAVGSTQVNGPGDTGQHAFITRGGVPVDLGTGYPGVGSGSAATAVNASGQIIGYHYPTQATPVTAVTWRGGKLSALRGLGGRGGAYGVTSQANAINAAGLIVGVAQPRDTRQAVHGALWQNGAVTDLGNLGGTGEDTTANGINDHATVVGRSYIGTQLHAFVWKAGVMRDLSAAAATPAGRDSEAFAVNNADTVVGYTQVAAGPGNGWQAGILAAMIWRNGIPTNLDRLVTNLPKGMHLRTARAINDNGDIVGEVCTVADDCIDSDTYALIPIS